MQLAMLVHSYSKREVRQAPQESFFNNTILEFMGKTSETSEANKDNIDLLFKTQKQEGGATGVAHLHICQGLK